MSMDSTTFKDFYAVLGVSRIASSDDIRKAYKKRALETHPDKLDPGATDEERAEADDQFHLVREAFETLGDVEKRKAYDVNLKVQKNPSLISDKARELKKQREEWAKRLQEETDRRRAEHKEALLRQEQLREQLRKPKVNEEELVDEVVNNMFAQYPALAAKREYALKRKAEREKEKELQDAQRRIVCVEET